MKRHCWQEPGDRVLLVVNGGPSNPDGWFVATENHPTPGRGESPPWRRRYYPPGYGYDPDNAWTLLRVLPNRHEWWVEPLTAAGPMLGPFPDKQSAWAAWRLMQ